MKVFGLKNCSTCVKAQKWLEANGIAFEFQDVRQMPPSAAQLQSWSLQLGWDKLINKKSQTWRSLTDEQKELTAEADLIALVQANPSLMKRPLLESDKLLLVGFVEADYQKLKK
ncbi:Spx/MgsR family RNA polymerase-binding regulatory protein [Pelistega europaea]|uniref:Spx/MgsR family RNA polymerase-binding regulatory protein n=1 Tax=Pelistega europaea TaxID=106147 RepID=A0A7Y4L9U7_9BURK|nr:Spx/MgsR family RNA polymerase-binding regulatory protein [Pelistega europaea]NOL49660.1 Spx/MgsR family RNA polymerase-binding regulatory protein [Pelistega europaea]